ncbi:MAG: 4Fe-4S dicluster domain-containing protein [Candidatus Hermodarchaeota archaeon]
MNYMINKKEFLKFLDTLKGDFEVYAPTKEKNGDIMITAANDKELVADMPKTARSPKNLFLPMTETLMTYEMNDKGLKSVKQAPYTTKKRVLVGIRPCDLAAVPIMQKLFRTTDAPMKARIDNTTFIVLNCNQSCSEMAFCSSVGTGPFAKDSYDIALTDMGDEYLVEIGSSKGEQLIKGKITTAADKSYKKKKTDLQKKSEESFSIKFDVRGIENKLSMDDKRWEEKGKACMRCGACNYVCPTCVCFNVIDQHNERIRIWDSCLLSGFTLLAGGENPREKLKDRIIQRYFHKFQYTKINDDYHSCVGCGRCSEVCLFNDDMGMTLQEISKQ